MTTIKRTTVYIAMGGHTQVFRAAEDMPAALRKKLASSTKGMNSATILIADRGGREEIRKILNGEPSELHSRLHPDYLKRSLGKSAAEANREALMPAASVDDPYHLSWRQWGWRHWAELVLPGMVGVALWLLFTLR